MSKWNKNYLSAPPKLTNKNIHCLICETKLKKANVCFQHVVPVSSQETVSHITTLTNDSLVISIISVFDAHQRHVHNNNK